MKLEILIVEDHDSLRQMMAEHLRGCGLGVREASSFIAFNQALLQSVPHVLLLDLNLPDADGLDVLVRLRQAHPAMGVVVITGRGQWKSRESGSRMGERRNVVKYFRLVHDIPSGVVSLVPADRGNRRAVHLAQRRHCRSFSSFPLVTRRSREGSSPSRKWGRESMDARSGRA